MCNDNNNTFFSRKSHQSKITNYKKKNYKTTILNIKHTSICFEHQHNYQNNIAIIGSQSVFFQKNYFLQWNTTAADSSQSNISRLYILKKHSYQNYTQEIFELPLIIRNQSSPQKSAAAVIIRNQTSNSNQTNLFISKLQ